MQLTELNKLIIDVLEDNKAADITTIDVNKLTGMTDQLIICTATSTRHALALANHVVVASKRNGLKPYGVEGDNVGDWVLIDLQDIVVHIMLAETREFYSLEKLWTVTETARQSQAK